jgi:iron(II)-dependent oxidoreductase
MPPELDALQAARRHTLRLVAHLDQAQLEAAIVPYLSPMAWDLGHIAAFEDLWIAHRLGGMPLLRAEHAALYDAFETPREVRAGLDFLRGEALREYMDAVRARSAQVDPGDGTIFELVVRHEYQHAETMLQAMALAGLRPPGFRDAGPAGGDGLDLVEMPAGEAEIGAGPDGFAYDNERPRHVVALEAYAIGRTPVSNATWLSFAEGGGYERREWWSAEGWAWKLDEDIECPSSASTGDPDDAVVHVSWFEAEAFARSVDARLPTELEWEKAVLEGRLAGVGSAWEWTQSRFSGYPGFRAHPYREYSEVFFGDGYRVLRGRSAATHPHVASPHFRNWDLPRRRQIFSGVRIARGGPV